jgi:hypothetical protein
MPAPCSMNCVMSQALVVKRSQARYKARPRSVPGSVQARSASQVLRSVRAVRLQVPGSASQVPCLGLHAPGSGRGGVCASSGCAVCSRLHSPCSVRSPALGPGSRSCGRCPAVGPGGQACDPVRAQAHTGPRPRPRHPGPGSLCSVPGSGSRLQVPSAPGPRPQDVRVPSQVSPGRSSLCPGPARLRPGSRRPVPRPSRPGQVQGVQAWAQAPGPGPG